MSRLKTCLVISTFLHAALLSSLFHNKSINIQHHKTASEQSHSRDNLEIIPPDEITMQSAKIADAKKKGYYGIGIYNNPIPETVVCEGKFYIGWQIDIAISGYPAQMAGMMPRDIVIEIDGGIIKNIQDLIGLNESPITIGICRNGIKRTVTMKRQFIRVR